MSNDSSGITLRKTRVEKISQGIYMDKDVLTEAKEIAARSGISTNEALCQLLSLGLETAKEGQ